MVVRHLILLNVWLIGVSGNSTVDLTSSVIIRKLIKLWSDIKAFMLSSKFLTFQDLGSVLFTIATLVTIISLVAMTVWIVWTSLTIFQKRFTTPERHQSAALQQLILIGVAGLLITLTGLAAAALTSLGPVIRHAIPGIFMIKFVLAWMIADTCINKQVAIYKAFGWFMSVSVILASPVTLAAISGFHYKNHHANQIANLQKNISTLRELEVVRSDKGRMYGDFWDAYHYAVLTDTTLSPAPVQVSEGKVVSFDFLSAPEILCRR
jgi:hypothetical protein